MNQSTRRFATATAAIAAIGALTIGAAACGSSSSSDTTSTASTAAATAAATVEAGSTNASTSTTKSSTTAAATKVDVTLGTPTEFTLDMGSTTIPAGKVTFVVKNGGSMTHELVVLKTATPGADLKVSNGKADESGNIGETGDMAAGTTKSLTLTLKPGHYVMLCNLPGHYQGGMWKNVTVS